jgi:ABC-type transport system substrate-binding protein
LVAVIAALLVLSPASAAATGTYATPGGLTTSGPLISAAVFAVCSNDSTCSGLIVQGRVQAAEWTFGVAAWTSLCPPPQGDSMNSQVLCGSAPDYSWFGLGFNFVKFPGDNVNFRRAFQFLQDYSWIQSSILPDGLGLATSTPIPCFAFQAACNLSPMKNHYGTYQNLEAAGEELEQANDGSPSTALFCDNSGSPCDGTYNANSEWCTGYYCSQGGAPFSANLYYTGAHQGYLWGAAIIKWASQIGLAVEGHPLWNASSYDACVLPAALEVASPGVYNPSTGYNMEPVINASMVGPDQCDMFTYSSASPSSFLNILLESYDSRFAGTAANPGDVYDDPAFLTLPDSVAGYPSQTAHTSLNNLDYIVNSILYASTPAQEDIGAKYFMNAYALQVPSVSGYYENDYYAQSANGWTSFASKPAGGPPGLGLRYTLMNVHQCGAASCGLGAPGGATLGGTFNDTLEAYPDLGGLGPLYHSPWPWQSTVWENIYDSPLEPSPGTVNVTSGVDYLTTSHKIAFLPGATVLGSGGPWYYFQQPCTEIVQTLPTYHDYLSACRGRSGPGQNPGPLQHGVGLSASSRTINDGQEVTLTFRSGVYFFDGVPVSANDYLFTLNLMDVAESPNLPDSGSPARGILGGPAGLIAARLLNSKGGPCTVGCPTVELFLNSNSVWALQDLLFPVAGVPAPVLPAHIWRYFNPDYVTAVKGFVDASKPYAKVAGARVLSGALSAPAVKGASCGAWICYLNNLEVGSGPFWLRSWNPATGGVEVDANPFYFNLNWAAMAATNGTFEVGSGFADYPPVSTRSGCMQPGVVEPCVEVSLPLRVPMYNPTNSNITCANGVTLGPGGQGMCQLDDAMQGVSWAATGPAKVKVYDSGGSIVRAVPLSRNGSGYYYALIPTGSAHVNGVICAVQEAGCAPLASGSYLVVLQTTYFFHGQQRTWYQEIGFSIG